MRYLILIVIAAFLFSPAVALADTKKILDNHEIRIGELEQQAPAGGVTVRDKNGIFLGILLGYERQWPYYTQVFVPSLKKKPSSFSLGEGGFGHLSYYFTLSLTVMEMPLFIGTE